MTGQFVVRRVTPQPWWQSPWTRAFTLHMPGWVMGIMMVACLVGAPFTKKVPADVIGLLLGIYFFSRVILVKAMGYKWVQPGWVVLSCIMVGVCVAIPIKAIGVGVLIVYSIVAYRVAGNSRIKSFAERFRDWFTRVTTYGACLAAFVLIVRLFSLL